MAPRVHRDGGFFPAWSQDGREIFIQESGSLMAAPVKRRADGVGIGPPAKLGSSEAPFTGPYASDGKRFRVIQGDPAPAGVPMQVIHKWSALPAGQSR